METTMLNNNNSQSSFMPMAPQDNSYRNNNGFVQHRKNKKKFKKNSSYSHNNNYDEDDEYMDGSFIARNSGFNMGGNNNGYNNTSASSSLPRVRNKNQSNNITSAMVGERSQTVSDLKQLRAAYAELQSQYSRLEASESSARSHLQQSAAQFSELQEQAKKHKRGYDKYKETSKRNEITIQDLKAEQEELQKIGLDSKNQMNEMKQMIEALHLQISNLNLENTKLKNNVKDNEKIIIEKNG